MAFQKLIRINENIIVWIFELDVRYLVTQETDNEYYFVQATYANGLPDIKFNIRAVREAKK